MSKFYITGDKHGDFTSLFLLQNQCECFTPEDTLIILGDAGINYYVHPNLSPNASTRYTLSSGAKKKAKQLAKRIPCTIFCIHGNHEARPEAIDGYQVKTWNGGEVYFHPDFPSILFAKDGEIYHLNGHDYLVLGGAYSVDKWYRLQMDAFWFDDEQISQEAKARAEKRLDARGNRIHGILSHTCPYKYRPVEMFLASIDQSTVDNTMEHWMDEIEENTDYDIWYFGHYHGDKTVDKMCMMFHRVKELE